jgi:GDP/UDP-N,N'-diacetylbacillosamine 2-epimerase (hydrolysing)
MTVNEIENDNIPIDRKIEILLSSDTHVAISKSMGLAMISFAEYFDQTQPDALMVLGDRYETLAVCIAAMNACIPIIHLYGGETTEGAVDEAIRHAITKMSYLHFTSTEDYRRRVIQMGEAPERVYTVGALGIENALHTPLMTKEELEESLECSLGERYAVGTFHPVTLEKATAKQQTEELLQAIKAFPEITFLFTKANADADGRMVNQILEEAAQENRNIHLYDSLGMKRYLSAVKGAMFVIGNSSSGLIEVPSFHIPTVNIGDRQKGRIQGETIINCRTETESIIRAIEKACTNEFKRNIQSSVNPYGNGDTSDKIVELIKEQFIDGNIQLKKKFYTITLPEME